MDYINQLLDLILSPFGLLGCISGLFVVSQAKRSPHIAWLLISLCGFAASLGKFQDQWIKEPPALVFPLEFLRDAGRPLAILVMCMILLLALQQKNSWQRPQVSHAIIYLVILQGVIFIKTLAYGSITHALLAILTFAALVQMIRVGPARWLRNDQSFRLGVAAIAWVGVIFVLVNAYQAVFDLHAITFVHGRLLGTTGNPQHAAVLLSTTLPCFIFSFEQSSKRYWLKWFWLFALIAVMVALTMTGSRTGMVMAVVTIIFFYQNRIGTLLRFLGITAIALFLLFLLTGQGSQVPLIETEHYGAASRLLSLSNSREQVWTAMWRIFLQNPILGTPLIGDRLGYGENSWLAAAANTGIGGLIPLSLFGIACIRLMQRLIILGQKQPRYFLHSSVVVSGIASLLVGSFFEAYLLSNLTFALIALLLYLSLGQYLLNAQHLQERLHHFSLSQYLSPSVSSEP